MNFGPAECFGSVVMMSSIPLIKIIIIMIFHHLILEIGNESISGVARTQVVSFGYIDERDEI